MDLKEFTLMKDDPDSYIIGHPSGRSMTIPKRGMSDQAQRLISKLKRSQGLESGGDVRSPTKTTTGTGGSSPGGALHDPVQGLAGGGKPLQVEPIAPDDSDTQPAVPPPKQPLDVEPVAPSDSSQPSVTADQETAQAPANQPTPPTAANPQVSPTPTDSNPMTIGLGNQNLQQAEKATQAGATAEALQGKTAAQALGDANSQVQQIQQQYQDRVKGYQLHDQQLQKQLSQGHIDPDRYMNNMDTGSKIAAGLGMIIGGIGSGMTGGPNLAVQQINKSIENDINSQMNDQSKTMNLWKMNKEALQDDTQATLATQNQLLSIAKSKAMQAAATAQGPIAQARIAPLILSLDQQMQQNNQTRGLFDMQNQPASSGGPGSSMDPSLLVNRFVPEGQKAKVFDEIEKAANVHKQGASIMDAFDHASKENTIMRTGFGYLRTPASVLALHQGLQPTFKDLEGKINIASMENTFKDVTPSPGDSDDTIATKRKALQNYLQSKASAPTAKGNYIDLNKFQSTSSSSVNRQAPGKVVSIKGKQYEVGADGDTLTPL